MERKQLKLVQKFDVYRGLSGFELLRILVNKEVSGLKGWLGKTISTYFS